MKTKILIALLLCLVLTGLVNAAEKVAFTQISIDEALVKARKKKKLLFLCIHSIFGMELPKSIEEILDKSCRAYALKRAIFVKVLSGIPDDSGTTKLNKQVLDFLKKYKYPTTYTGPIILILDQYGNVLEKLEKAKWQPYLRSYAKYEPKTVLNFFKKAIKKAQTIKKNFKASYKKADQYFKRGKPLAGVKELNEIIDTVWQGYEVFGQAKQDLKNMRIMINETKKAIDDFLISIEDLDEDASGSEKGALTEKAVDLLHFICEIYKSTAFCQEIRKTTTLLEENKFDELEKELDVLSDVLDALPDKVITGGDYPPEQKGHLIAYWKFDEISGTTAKDSSGNRHEGKVHGAKRVNGKIGRALKFDGKDDYVEGPAMRQRSVMMWVKPTDREKMVLYDGGRIGRNDQAYYMGIYPPGGWANGQAFDTTYGLWLAFWYNDVVISYDKLKSGWHHIAISWDGNVIVKIGIDGKFPKGYVLNRTLWSAEQSQPFILSKKPSPDTTVTTLIGKSRNPSWRIHFKGLIDEVKIYSHALSVEEIEADYKRSK